MAVVRVRPATPADAPALVAIYNQGIEERQATFETALRSVESFEWRIGEDAPPLLVAESDGEVVGWAGVGPYSEREIYAGVGECTIYVERAARGSGVGRHLLEELCAECERRGYYKLIGKLFASNETSVGLFRRCGFRVIGVHYRHGRLDGKWKDVAVVERLLGEALQAG
jgi:L-amino acid N-acyltransferase YncA